MLATEEAPETTAVAEADAQALCRRSLDSLRLAIELFNRPSDTGRTEAVLILLHHSFEMLLKSVIVDRTGTVFDDERGYSYAFDTCLRIAEQELKVIDRNQRGFLSALDAMRDSAMHYYQVVSEDMLYVMAQGSVSLFDYVIRQAGGGCLVDHLPNRVMAICARPPQDLNLLIDKEFRAVKALMDRPGLSEQQATAMLRSLLALERAGAETPERMTVEELKVAAENLKAAENWRVVFPQIAKLSFASEGSGITVGFRVVKDEAAMPVRIMKPDEAGNPQGTIIMREVNILDKFNLGLRELASKLGLTPQKTLVLVYEYDLQNNREMFRSIPIGTQPMKRYSKAALDFLRTKVAEADSAWSKHGHRFRKHQRDAK